MITSLKDQESLKNTINNVYKTFDDKKLTANMVKAFVANAFEVVNTNWSLKSFIAINPMKGFEDEHFLKPQKQPLNILMQNHSFISISTMIYLKKVKLTVNIF